MRIDDILAYIAAWTRAITQGFVFTVLMPLDYVYRTYF